MNRSKVVPERGEPTMMGIGMRLCFPTRESVFIPPPHTLLWQPDRLTRYGWDFSLIFTRGKNPIKADSQGFVLPGSAT